MNKPTSWMRRAPGALFVGVISQSADSVVATGGAAVAGVGTVALVALFLPGAVHSCVVVAPK